MYWMKKPFICLIITHIRRPECNPEAFMYIMYVSLKGILHPKMKILSFTFLSSALNDFKLNCQWKLSKI